MSNKLRIGVLGCAAIAERMVIPAILLSEHYKLIAVASRTIGKAESYAQKFDCEAIEGYEKMLQRSDIDVVYIPLPTGMHAEWAIKALEYGKHILIEKSLAAAYSDAERIIDLAKQKNLLVMENFMFEYHRQFSMIREIIKNNTLGNLRCVRSSFGFPPFPDSANIRYNASLGGGALLDAGAYTIKVAAILTEQTPDIIGATSYTDNAKGVDIFGGMLMKYPDGCVIETAYGFDHYYQCSLEVWGSHGRLTADRIFTAGPGISPKIHIETKEEKKTIEVEPDNHFLNLIDQFASQVQKNSFNNSYERILLQARLMRDVMIAGKNSSDF